MLEDTYVDSDGPDVEDATFARERNELLVAAEEAALRSRKAERRARSLSKERASLSSKFAIQEEKEQNADNDLPDEVLEDAATAADAADANLAAVDELAGLRRQNGRFVYPQHSKLIDGVEHIVISKRTPRLGPGAPGQRALTFLRNSLYGQSSKRVKADEARRKGLVASGSRKSSSLNRKPEKSRKGARR